MIKFIKEIYSALKYGISPTPYDFYRTVQPLVQMPPCKPAKEFKMIIRTKEQLRDFVHEARVEHPLYYGMREIFPKDKNQC